jgi:uncharacterized protein YecT (DUF1311 family)
MLRLAVAIALSLPAFAAQAQSCAETAADRQALNECTQAEILPLETKVVHLFNALRSKYKPDAKLLESFENSQDAWNAYRNGHCSIEAAARGGGAEIAVKRAFVACAKRTLEARVRELEAL